MEISKKIKSLLLRNEKWLPIINESGTVYGKITYSQSISKKNKYLHPIVRIALIHNGKIFLSEKKNIVTNIKTYLDYPFQRHVFYKESLEDALTKTFESIESESDLNRNCAYLFHYIHHSEKINRLVYFYLCPIHDDSLLKKINTSNGEWWNSRQIKENLNTGLFSPFFENEFKFLDSTVLTFDCFTNIPSSFHQNNRPATISLLSKQQLL